jgi:CheY-like chemotaxis protein
MPNSADIRIFLAEDDSDDQDIFLQAIRDITTAVSVKVFSDGMALMDALASGSALPDILFLDLNMPGKSGFDCLAEIKCDALLKKIHVIILSTSTHPQNVDYCFRYGASFYAVKPPDYRTLTKLIKKAIGHDWNAEISKDDFLLDFNPFFLRHSVK